MPTFRFTPSGNFLPVGKNISTAGTREGHDRARRWLRRSHTERCPASASWAGKGTCTAVPPERERKKAKVWSLLERTKKAT